MSIANSQNVSEPLQTPSLPRTGEFNAILMLSLGFALVGLDRFILAPLFPTIAKDLGLDYQDLGLTSGILALTYGFASIFTGQLADRIGRKRVFLPALITFSLLVGLSGLSVGLLSLLLFRALMGVSEGAYMPAGITAAADASKPSRLGLNIGITQLSVGLAGLGLGPIIATQLLKIMSWQWIFAVVALPGFVLAFFMHRYFHDVPHADVVHGTEVAARGQMRETLRLPQIWAVTIACACWFSSLVILSAFYPTYLADELKLDLDSMGLVLSAGGIGAVFGMLVLSFLSDRLGRKPMIVAALLLLAGVAWLLMHSPADPIRLFVLVFLFYFFNAGIVAIGIGPLASHSVPARLAGTATGIVIGAGEIIGGAGVPAATGALAQAHGIASIFTVILSAILACLFIMVVFVREPTFGRSTKSRPAAELC